MALRSISQVLSHFFRKHRISIKAVSQDSQNADYLCRQTRSLWVPQRRIYHRAIRSVMLWIRSRTRRGCKKFLYLIQTLTCHTDLGESRRRQWSRRTSCAEDWSCCQQVLTLTLSKLTKSGMTCFVSKELRKHSPFSREKARFRNTNCLNQQNCRLLQLNQRYLGSQRRRWFL